jgi:hypothetical protein
MLRDSQPSSFDGMKSDTFIFWVGESLLSLLAVAVISWTNSLIFAELLSLLLAFLLVVIFGGPGKVLALGVGLGLALAIVGALVAGSEAPGMVDIFPSPGEAFASGLLGSGAVYPGWALGTGLGALARSGSPSRPERSQSAP